MVHIFLLLLAADPQRLTSKHDEPSPASWNMHEELSLPLNHKWFVFRQQWVESVFLPWGERGGVNKACDLL